MSSPARRRLGCVIAVAAAAAAAAAALALPAAASHAATHAAAPAKAVGGLVPDVPTGGHLRRPPTARIASNLPYGGGPVLHSNRTHLIFWQPAGSGLTYDPGYEAQAETFLSNVAADSRKPTNVYGLSGQYTDSAGPAAYDTTYGGAVLATDPLPASDCSEPLLQGPGWGVCLSDAKLEAEIEHVIGVDRLPTTSRDVYFLMMPSGLGSCESTGPQNCALGGGTDGYCGYHTSSPDGSILYAVIPYNAVQGHCQSDNPRPNSSTADPSLSTLSHEHNEMVTDPFGDAWIDGSSNEDGDLCIAQYGASLGGSGTGQWDEQIHGGHYFLQEEWSNDSGSCQPRDESDPVSFSARARVSPRKSISFTARASDPDGSISAYDWFFGEGPVGHHRIASHAFRHTGSFNVVLRITDRAGNRAFYARTIRVASSAIRDRGRAR